jgi:glucoamylase
MPLMWAHAEYIKLLRSVQDGAIFDRIEAVANRYGDPHQHGELEVWKFNRRVKHIPRGRMLRIQAHAEFRLRFTTNAWQTQSDRDSTDTGIDIHYCDISPNEFQDAPLQFTFFWTNANHWEGTDYQVDLS